MKIGKITLILCLLAAFVFSVAQVTVTPRSASVGRLLLRKDVQDDLALSKEVRAKLQKAYDDCMKAHNVDVQDDGAGHITMHGMGLREASDEFDKTAPKFLTESQKTRLHEIDLQVNGFLALDRADVQKALKFTDAQKSQIQAIAQKAKDEQRDIVMDAGGRIDESVIDKIKKVQQGIKDSYGKVLTDQQRANFAKMQGKPFKSRES